MPRLIQPTDDAILQAASVLRDGRVVAFPTETVYGLGADTFNTTALQRVFALKGRPERNPLIAHVLDEGQARRVVTGWDDRCSLLAARFWPGPLTIVLRRAGDVPDRATAGWPTIAVRAPDHPVARDLLGVFGGPISAPSANRSGGVSPTTAAHVADDFAEVDDLLILDGGPCEIGIESTVVDLSAAIPTVLRPGAVSAGEIRDVIGEVAGSSASAQTHSPGTSTAHYAPRTAAEVVACEGLENRLAKIEGPVTVLCFEGTRLAGPHRTIVMPDDPDAYAARLYGALREADQNKPARILIVEPASTAGLWGAICDRLNRATGAYSGTYS